MATTPDTYALQLTQHFQQFLMTSEANISALQQRGKTKHIIRRGVKSPSCISFTPMLAQFSYQVALYHYNIKRTTQINH